MKNQKVLPTALLLLSVSLVTGCNLFGKKSFKVTWKNYDGSILEIDENVTKGAVASYDGEAPVRAKTDSTVYEFIGWDKDVSEITEDTTYTATYKESKREYEITWLNYDNSVLAVTSVGYGDVPSISITPTRPGTLSEEYTFAGWDRDLAPVTGNTSYKAIYTSQTFEVIEIRYEFTNTVHTVTNTNPTKARVGSKINLIDAKCPGYDFSKWFLDESHTKPISEIPNIDHNITLYGVFKLRANTITYYDGKDKIDNPANPTSLKCTDPKVTLVKYNKVGYEFVKWQDASGKVYKELVDVCTDLNLYAISKANSYVITLKFSDQSNQYIHINYDDEVKLPELKRNGYKFEGWFYENEPTQKFELKKYTITSDIVLIPVWTVVEYKITYKVDDSTTLINPPAKFSIEDMPALPVPTKTGYEFKGWKYKTTQISVLRDVFENINGVYNDVLFGEQKTLELTADWAVKDVKIYLNFDGGTLERKIEFYNANELVKTSYVSPYKSARFELLNDKENQQFGGWLDENGTIFSFASDVSLDKDIKLNAVWEEVAPGVEGKKIGDTISFNVNGFNQKTYQFTPLIDQEVTFISEGSLDICAELIAKKNSNIVAQNDDISSTDKNFSFKCVLKAYDTYLLKVSSNSLSSGEMKIKVTSSATGATPSGLINTSVYTVDYATQKFEDTFSIPFFPVKDGYLFDGWADVNNTSVRYQTGTTVLKEEIINLIALWKKA